MGPADYRISGEALSKKEMKRRQKFYDSIGFTCLMQFGDGQGIDGVVGGNESRFINHSTQANVGALRESEWRIVFYSLDDIAQGEELTFNYGFDPKKISAECQDSGRCRVTSQSVSIDYQRVADSIHQCDEHYNRAFVTNVSFSTEPEE